LIVIIVVNIIIVIIVFTVFIITRMIFVFTGKLQHLTMRSEYICCALILGIVQKIDAPVYSKSYAAHGQANQA